MRSYSPVQTQWRQPGQREGPEQGAGQGRALYPPGLICPLFRGIVLSSQGSLLQQQKQVAAWVQRGPGNRKY